MKLEAQGRAISLMFSKIFSLYFSNRLLRRAVTPAIAKQCLPLPLTTVR